MVSDDQHIEQTSEHLTHDNNDCQHGISSSVEQNVIDLSDINDDNMDQPLIQESYKYASQQNPFITITEVAKNSDRSHSNSSKLITGEQQRRPWFIWIVSLVQICIFIVGLAKNWILTGSPIQIKPFLSPLLGSSPWILINMGACFSPCMHTIKGITDNTFTGWPCPNSTTFKDFKCTLSNLCGFNGVSSEPNQWYRFIIPIFMHGGIVHITLNLLLQLLLGTEMEKKIGTFRLIPIYFLSGIFGFVFGGNFAPEMLPRIGCSGSIFAIIALSFLDLLYNWSKMKNPRTLLIIMLLSTIFDLGLGLIPFIDNFSHLGGFCMGLLLGLAILGSPTNLQQCEKTKKSNYSFKQKYRRFFNNRTKHWWTWWLVRFIALTVAIIISVIMVQNFYTQRIKCHWCKYISCLPIKNWCDLGRLSSSPVVSSWTTKKFRYDNISMNWSQRQLLNAIRIQQLLLKLNLTKT